MSEEEPQTLAEGTSSSTPSESPKTSSPSPSVPSESSSAISPDGKVTVLFKNTGNANAAPPMKQKHFKLNASYSWKTVQLFLRKQLKYDQSNPLFLFVNSTFQPSPDETVAELAKCFHNNGKLIINYTTTVAWG